jgi:hypothetical protein
MIPGVGPLLLAGPIVGWLLGALGEAVLVGGLSALGACLYSQGIPKNSVLKYETAVKSGKFVIIAHGTTLDATRARDIISGTNPEAVEHHDLSPVGAKADLVAV